VPFSRDKPLEEKEYPDEGDLQAGDDEGGSSDLVCCPACGELIWAQAQRCPHCKEWVVAPGQGWRASRKWYVRGGLYLARTLALNWLFWLVVAAVGAIVAIREVLR
jgi:hypothetical protein